MAFIEKHIGKHIMRIDSKQRGLHGTLRKWPDGCKNCKREPELLYVIEKEIKPGMTVLDLGANIGYVSFIMADLLKGKGSVHCIEPDPRNIELLRYNIKANVDKFGYDMKLYPLAVSNKKGKIKFCLGSSSNLSSISKSRSTRGTVIVKTNTLTNFFRKKDKPNFIKMDIEGAEVEVLDGAYSLFKNHQFPCKIVMEVHPTYFSKKHNFEEQLRRYITDLGFKTKYVISAGMAVPDLFKELGYTKPDLIFNSSGYKRALYTNFKDEDMLKVACWPHKQLVKERHKMSNKIVRYVMIERS